MDVECSAAPCPVPSWGTKHKGRTRFVPGYSRLGCHPLLRPCFSSASRKGAHRKRGHVVAFEELLTPKHPLIFFCPQLSQCRETFPRQAGVLSQEDFLASCSHFGAGQERPQRREGGTRAGRRCAPRAVLQELRAGPRQLREPGHGSSGCLSAGSSSPSAVRAAQWRAGAALCGSRAPRAAPQQLQPAGARDAARLRCTHRASAP